MSIRRRLKTTHIKWNGTAETMGLGRWETEELDTMVMTTNTLMAIYLG